MNKARSIGLAVQYRSTPYSAQVQASAQVDAAEGGGSAASSASSGSGAAAGQAVTLNNTPLYVSSVAKNPATHKTGVYYFYDGILIRGRYRITNTPSRVGKTPVGQNVTGWADAADCGAVSSAKATPKKETSGQENATLGAGTGTDIGLSIESLTYVDNAAERLAKNRTASGCGAGCRRRARRFIPACLATTGSGPATSGPWTAAFSWWTT